MTIVGPKVFVRGIARIFSTRVGFINKFEMKTRLEKHYVIPVFNKPKNISKNHEPEIVTTNLFGRKLAKKRDKTDI